MKKIQTRFMSANKDTETVVFDLLVEHYGISEVCGNEFDYCEALFSDGFIAAIQQDGVIPVLGSETPTLGWDKKHGDKEYHHAIINDVCYNVFFKSIN